MFLRKSIYIMLAGMVMLSGQQFLNIRVNNDTTTQVQNEQQIVVNPLDSLNFVCNWRDFRVGYRQVGHAATFDGGRTWIAETLFVEPTYIWDSDPGMTVDKDGNFFAIILSFNSTSQPNGYFVYESTDKGLTWSAPRTVVNNVPNVFEDKEFMTCDRTTDSPYEGNLYVTWARFINYSSPAVYFTRSTDRGFTWTAPFNVSDVNGGLQFPVPAVGPAGEVYVAWVTNSQILIDRSNNGGISFGTDRLVQNVASMLRYVKGAISTFSFPALDIDISGGPYDGYVYAAFMDDGTDGYPDMFFTRSTDQGQTWSSRVRINDDPQNNNIDQFHPWLTVDKTGCISVIFYDSRNDPANILTDLYLAQSTDGGVTWLPNVRVTDTSFDLTAGSYREPFFDPSQPLADRAGLIGEYNGVAATSPRNVVPIYTDTRSGNQDTYVAVPVPAAADEVNAIGLGDISFGPNPWRGSSRLWLTIPVGGLVWIDMYDASGRKVDRLFTGTMPPGLHCLNLKRPAGLTQGVYFLQITSGSYASTVPCVIW